MTLEAHQKAADYTVDRSRTAVVGTVIDAALLLAFTLGGGLGRRCTTSGRRASMACSTAWR